MEHTYRVVASNGDIWVTEGVTAVTYEGGCWTLFSGEEDEDSGQDILASYYLPISIHRQREDA